tara:strand:+ start:1943 stop:2677 length:735 start_codon:yes stop_codon:yes gene_type:complete
MPGMLWVDGETYGVRAVKANEHECDWGNDYWTYVVDYNRAKEAFTSAMNELQDIAPDHSLVIALGSRNNFRYSVYSKYKSNRVKQRKPAGLSDFYLWMQDHWPCQTYNGVEGDDVIGINADADNGDVIASLDKDLKTIRGVHIERGGLIDVSEYEADYKFYTQALTGDSADGYPGCPGVGPKRAENLLKDAKTAEEMWAVVLGAYTKAHLSRNYALQMARCARILRAGEYDMDNERPLLWQPPD